MEVIHDLGLDGRTMLVNVVGFVLLLWLLRRYTYGPIAQILGDRARDIEASLSDAKRQQEMALADKRRDGAAVRRRRGRRAGISSQTPRSRPSNSASR